jgi:biopolymer transport protein ExbB
MFLNSEKPRFASRRQEVWSFVTLTALTCLVLFTISTMAQAPVTPPDIPPPQASVSDTAAAERELGQSVWETIKNGGFVMIAIGALSIVALGLIINYFFTIQVGRLIPKELLRKIYALINENNFQDAITLCESIGGFIPTVVAEGLKRRGRDHEALLQAMEVTGRREADYLRQKIRYLYDVATLSPLLGLLGTVLGMIQAFNVVALDPAVVKPILLAQAVSKALVTTAAGLIIAIPAMAFYFYFRGRVQWIIGMMEDISEEFADRITEVQSRSQGGSWRGEGR